MVWLLDEDINIGGLTQFKKSGIKAKHIKYDLGYEGRGDEEVLQIAKDQKRTLITANPDDFKSLNNTKFLQGFGVWILQSQNTKEQAVMLKRALKATGLTTRDKRKEKKVIIHKEYVEVIDCRTGSKLVVEFK